MLKIQITNLTDGAHRYQFNETREQIGLGGDGRFPWEVEVELDLEKQSGRFQAQTRVRTRGNFICDRCLDEFERWVDQEVASNYFLSSEAVPENFKDEVKYLSPNSDYLDISEDVRDALLLSIPMKQLCGDFCKGLCLTCGVNKNHGTCTCPTEQTDTRWDGLKKIQLDR